MSGPVQWSFLPAPALTSAPSRSATISTDGLYRYDLTRRWLPGDDWAVWVMLNPSTADADQDDPTIRRCIAFTKREGLGGMAVVNLYAYRATDPKALAAAGKAGVDIVGPDNVQYLERWAAKAQVLIARRTA